MILKANSTKSTAIAPRPNLPQDYKGPVSLPTGREVYWTGRVAIGLNYKAPRHVEMSSNEEWLQKVLLRK
jgi:hypothetical protein